ncbi:hypothetical protein U9M48_002983 [Paspalum notatum var. saurae]|uniref:Uncharacterized protein n=1 Tax=Paspalum notatum var. saurae TaxID=547442 RepID=A0AAQ3PII2_PASNO
MGFLVPGTGEMGFQVVFCPKQAILVLARLPGPVPNPAGRVPGTGEMGFQVVFCPKQAILVLARLPGPVPNPAGRVPGSGPFWCSRNSRDPSRTRPDGFSQNVSEGCRVMFQPIFLTEHEL